MSNRSYHFLINSFLVATQRSYVKLLILGAKHEASLIANQADPAVAAILATYVPVFDAYKATDVNLLVTLGYHKGSTMSVQDLFDNLTKTQLPAWEGKVFNHFPKGTTVATELFPRGRSPFNKGTYAYRLQAIEAFIVACNEFLPLQPLAVIVNSFHVQIASARAMQMSDGEAKVALLRTLRDTARTNLCSELYGNLALLVHRFRTNPDQVERFFDFELLRQRSKPNPKPTIIPS